MTTACHHEGHRMRHIIAKSYFGMRGCVTASGDDVRRALSITLLICPNHSSLLMRGTKYVLRVYLSALARESNASNSNDREKLYRKLYIMKKLN